MSGILDNKSRVMDTILTQEGKRQISSANLKIKYVSFTDSATYYKGDIVSGSANASERIYFESCNLPQDQITFEADDSGQLLPFKNGNSLNVKSGQILSYSFDALTTSILTGSVLTVASLKGAEFASTTTELLASSIENFIKLRLLGSTDKIFDDDGFLINNSDITFTINDTKPISDPTQHSAKVNDIDSLFQDVRLSKLKNFHYLPPINKVDNTTLDKTNHLQTSQYHLGNYQPWGRTQLEGLSPEQLEYELGYYERLGYAKSIKFDPTSTKNRLVGQMFEINYDNIKKLDIIDYGTYIWQNTPRQAFFIGKIVIDDNGTHNFIHLFTLVFGG